MIQQFNPSTYESNSLSIFRMGLFPILNPLGDSCAIAVDISVLFTVQFNDNLLVICFTGFFEQYAKDLCIEVFLKLFLVVSSINIVPVMLERDYSKWQKKKREKKTEEEGRNCAELFQQSPTSDHSCP